MQKQFIFFITLSIIVAIFAITNAEVMTIRLIFWSFDMSGSILILLSVLLGALLVFVFGTVRWVKTQLQIKELKKELEGAYRSIDELTHQKNQLSHQVKEVQLKLDAVKNPPQENPPI